jgi:hypothetical protein
MTASPWVLIGTGLVLVLLAGFVGEPVMILVGLICAGAGFWMALR